MSKRRPKVTAMSEGPLRDASTESERLLRGKAGSTSRQDHEILPRPSPPLDAKKAEAKQRADEKVTWTTLRALADAKKEVTTLTESPLRDASTESERLLRDKAGSTSSDLENLLGLRPPLDAKKVEAKQRADEKVTWAMLRALSDSAKEQTDITQDGEASNSGLWKGPAPEANSTLVIYMAKAKHSRDKENVTASSPAGPDKPATNFEVKKAGNSDGDPSSTSSFSVAVGESLVDTAPSSAGDVEPAAGPDGKPTEPDPSCISVTATDSTSLLDTLPHTGSACLLETFKGFHSQWKQPDNEETPLTAPEQREVDENMPKFATRSEKGDPPLDLSLHEWESIVKVLKMNEPLSVQQVLCRLSKMTKRHCDLVMFYKCGFFDNALSLLLSKPDVPFIQNLTLKMIAELSCLPDCRMQILRSPQLIFLCMDLLKEDKSIQCCHEFASKILSSVSMSKSLLQYLMKEHDLIEVLLRRTIKTPDPDVRSNCLEIMLRLASSETTCKNFFKSKQFTLDLFTSLVGSKYFKIQQQALGMLQLLTKHEKELTFQENVRKSGVAKLIIEVLMTDIMRDFYHLAIEILSNIANTEFGFWTLRDSGAIAFLVDFIDQEENENLLACGLETVVRVALMKAGRAHLVEIDVPRQLVKYLRHEEGLVLERTCVAIANVAQHPEALTTIVACDPAEDLIHLFCEDKHSSQVKYAASRALFELSARDELMCHQIAKLHLTEVFHHIIWSGCLHVPTLGAISDTIQILSHYPAIKHYTINDESVACFLDIMQGHSNPGELSEEELENEEAPRIFATHCLRSFMYDPRCRELFSLAFGVYVLQNNLESSSLELRQATAVFIELAAKDPQLAFEMAVVGIVQIMLRDHQMISACPEWLKALQQIYDHHLPTKFAYCHRLDITDITDDGFYIAATQKGPITMLDLLLHERMCPMETIYVCNFSTERPQPYRSLHILLSPVWLPYTRQDPTSYPQALSRLSERGVAATWRHKLSHLWSKVYVDKSPNHSRANSLTRTGSPSSSTTVGKKDLFRNHSSCLGRRRTRRIRFPGRPLTPAEAHCDLPRAADPQHEELHQRLEVYRACPVDHELGKCLRRLRAEFLNHFKDDGEGEEETQQQFLAGKDVRKVAVIIAKFVALRMSGNKDKMPYLVSNFALSMKALKELGETNIVPVGHLKTGLHLERALLFKVLADRIGLPCSLDRGEDSVAFNEICVPCPNNTFPMPCPHIKPNFIVDLMSNVGRLYFVESREAYEYLNRSY